MIENNTFGMQRAWDRASAEYLARRGNDVGTVSYGNLAPDEAELGLLGELQGKRILDFGCGGGQSAVCCALAGADVVAVDFSEVQLQAAQQLARQHAAFVEFRQAAHLPVDASRSFDLIFMIQVLPYVDEPGAKLQAACALLKSGGRLIISLDHPLRNCFYDNELDELAPYPVRNYMVEDAIEWNFGAGLPMISYHRPLSQWLGLIIEAGMLIERLIEAPAPLAICDELWPEDSPLAPLRNIPHSAILVARSAL